MDNQQDLSLLRELIDEWAEFGSVDLSDWNGDQVLSLLSTHDDYREKFVALLQIRLGEPIQ